MVVLGGRSLRLPAATVAGSSADWQAVESAIAAIANSSLITELPLPYSGDD